MRQQLESFEEFVENAMQEIVDENNTIEVSPAAQFAPNLAGGEQKAYRIQFHQIYLSKPIVNENDGETSVLFPREARLRNLTYVEPIHAKRNELEARTMRANGAWAVG